MNRWLLALVTAALLLIAWCWHPVCVPIAAASAESDATYAPRRSESLWGVQTFQKRDGQWCQCKPWLARQLFF